MNINLFTSSTDDIQIYAHLTSKTKREYANKCNHKFLDFISLTKYCGITPFYEGLNLLIKSMELKVNDDWFWWIEADAAIMNQDIKIKNVLVSILNQNPGKLLIIGEDENGINTGSFLVKNTMGMHTLLKWLYEDKQFYSHPWGWQASLQKHYAKYDFVKEVVGIVDRLVFNSYLREYKPGDFVLHLPGMTTDERVKIFSDLITEV